jgi:hypothetical protein
MMRRTTRTTGGSGPRARSIAVIDQLNGQLSKALLGGPRFRLHPDFEPLRPVLTGGHTAGGTVDGISQVSMANPSSIPVQVIVVMPNRS